MLLSGVGKNLVVSSCHFSSLSVTAARQQHGIAYMFFRSFLSPTAVFVPWQRFKWGEFAMRFLFMTVLALIVCAPANAQNIPQKGKKWSISICEQNAARNGYRGGSNYCAQKAEEQRKKGRTVVP